MSRQTRSGDEPVGPVKVVLDFLPLPEELAYRDDTVKVTITRSRESVEFFKPQAKKHHTPYRR